MFTIPVLSLHPHSSWQIVTFCQCTHTVHVRLSHSVSAPTQFMTDCHILSEHSHRSWQIVTFCQCTRTGHDRLSYSVSAPTQFMTDCHILSVHPNSSWQIVTFCQCTHTVHDRLSHSVSAHSQVVTNCHIMSVHTAHTHVMTDCHILSVHTHRSWQIVTFCQCTHTGHDRLPRFVIGRPQVITEDMWSYISCVCWACFREHKTEKVKRIQADRTADVDLENKLSWVISLR